MGLGAWLARRALAAFLFAPLVAFWVVVLLVTFARSSPCAAGPNTAACQQWTNQIYVLSLALAAITDWYIVRRVKKAMKEGSAYR